MNLLNNGSFEGGWYHPDDIPELQIPNDWGFWYAPEDMPNPHDPNSWSAFCRPEVRVLPREQLPPDEQDIFILDGDHTLKIFKAYGAWYVRLNQTMVDLEPGMYRLTCRVWPDLVVSYDGDRKVWAGDAQGRDCLMRFVIDGSAFDWMPVLPPPKGSVQSDEFWRVKGASFITDGLLDIAIEFMCPFALRNSGIFLDNWSLELESELPPAPARGAPRVQYERTYHLLAPETTRAQAHVVLDEIYGYQGTLGWSADDAGVGDLDTRNVIAYHFPEQVHTKYTDFFATYYPGVNLSFNGRVEPPPLPQERILSGYHLQATFPNWLEHLERAHNAGCPMGAVRLIHAPHLAPEIKAVSPSTLVVYRHVDDNRGKYWAMYPDSLRAVETFTAQFWDQVEQYADSIDIVSSLNETCGTHEPENARNTGWFDAAFARWVHEHTGGAIRSEILTLPAGNPDVGELAWLREGLEAANAYNAILGPHTYPPALTGDWETTWRWLNEEGRYYHLRPLDIWVPEILAMGLDVPDFIFGETGPVASFNDNGKPGGFDLTQPGGLGWRVCLGGNIDHLIRLMVGYSGLVRAHPWGHKVISWNFFTSGRVGWNDFQANEDVWPGMVTAHLSQ